MRKRIVQVLMLALPFSAVLLPAQHHHQAPRTQIAAQAQHAPTQVRTERLGVSRSHFRDVPPTPIIKKPKPHPRPKPHIVRAAPIISGAYAWAHTPFALRVTRCEAPDGPTELDNNGGVYYFGKWQMNEDFVRTYGGVNPWDYVHHGRFLMPESMQDSIAYKGWKARGWQPWACASMV